MYDQEIVSFYDSEMVYQCDKIWPKDFEDYTDISFFLDHIIDYSTVRTDVLKDKLMMIFTLMSFDLEASPQKRYACNQGRI